MLTFTGTDLGLWQEWDVGFNNFTLGNGTVALGYTRIGSCIHGWIKISFGSSTVVGNGPEFTLPVPADAMENDPIGSVVMVDVSLPTDLFEGVLHVTLSQLAAEIVISGAATTYVGFVDVTSATPFTWAQFDGIWASFTYEAS